MAGLLWPLVVSHAADPARRTVDGVTVALCGALMPARASVPTPGCPACLAAIVAALEALTCPRCYEDRLVELEDRSAFCCVCGHAWKVTP